MNSFREEIYKLVFFLFICGERLLETESFIVKMTRRREMATISMMDGLIAIKI